MAKIKVCIVWNKQRKQWDMLDSKTGDFIQEFFPCKNFRLVFECVKKTGLNQYLINVERVK